MKDRSTTLAVLVFTGGAALWSCMEISPDEKQCRRACDIASRCGLLPSALGGNPSLSTTANEDECVDRCEASDIRDQQVAGLLELLDSEDYKDITSLCRPSGLRDCEELIEDLDANPKTSELSITTELTVFMNSAVSHATSYSLESWCCFDYDYDIYESPEDYLGDGINEIEKVHDMFQPTFECLTRSIENADQALESYEGADPDEPPSDEARAACDALRDDWRPPTQDEMGDVTQRPCLYALMSSRLQALDVSGRAMTCTKDDAIELSNTLHRTIDDWHLVPGDILIDASGTVRPVNGSADSVETLIEAEIRDEIARPMGFLENACKEFFEEVGKGYCDTAVRGEQLDAGDCSGGPPCNAADCLAFDEDDPPDCNPALCDVEISSPSRDCGFFGVTEIRLGYRTDDGSENFGEPILGCSGQADLVSVFPDVRAGVVTPIAVISGNLDPSLDPEGGVVGDGSYSWYIEGEPRWVSAGEAQLELASPLLDVLEHRYNNPLEFLEWVLPRLPTGQACDNRPDLCEGFFNDNCEDGLDNDGDGLVDRASAWCDDLFQELIERCVVTQPGREPPPDCRFDPPDPFGDAEPPNDDEDDPDSGEDPDTGLPDTDLPDTGLPDTGELLSTGSSSGTGGPPMGTTG